MPGAQVAIDDEVVAWAPAKELIVHAEALADNQQSWQWVSQHADNETVFNWLRTENLFTFEVDRIAWRMQDKGFFQECIAILSKRQYYSQILWAYAFKHHDAQRMGEYLSQREDFLTRCGPSISSPLVNSEPVKRVWYEHLEFKPLINSRAHQLSDRPWIANQSLAAHYESLLQRLSHQAELSADDRLEVLYYLLLQDRISDGLRWFADIDATAISAPVPYAYAKAWLGLASGKPEVAQQVIEEQKDLQHPQWKQRFVVMSGQLAEITGATALRAAGDIDPNHHRQAQLEANNKAEKTLNLSLSDGQPVLSWSGHETVELRYYFMDIELLFSRNPFQNVQNQEQPAAIIAPNMVQRIELSGPETSLDISLPPAARQRNVIIEAHAGGQRSSATVFAHNMLVNLSPAFGQLQVARKDTPAAKLHTTYVKVYREMENGDIQFHKDGYTDLRGRFDYSSANDVAIKDVKRFAILVLSEEHGAQINETAPPAPMPAEGKALPQSGQTILLQNVKSTASSARPACTA